jgi:hypothetical protein
LCVPGISLTNYISPIETNSTEEVFGIRPLPGFSDNMLSENEGVRCQCSGFRILRLADLRPDTYLNYRRACCPSNATFSGRNLGGKSLN